MADLKHIFENVEIHDKRCVAPRPRARGPGAAAAPRAVPWQGRKAHNLPCPAPRHAQTANPTVKLLSTHER